MKLKGLKWDLLKIKNIRIMNLQSFKWIGVDLGTYNSSAAIKSKNGLIEIIRDANRKPQYDLSFSSLQENCKEFPSFISFKKDGTIDDVGINSKEKAYTEPEFVAWGIKRLLGRTFIELKESGELDRFPFRIKPDRNNGQCLMVFGEKSYSPAQLCSEIFKRIKSETEKHINEGIDSVVVSVPAYFDPIRVTPIVEAARSAGFNNVRSIPEPVAAALAYNIDISVRPMKTLVFDLGAGTLDVTAGYLYRHSDQPGEFMFQVSKNTGDPRLGGMDMDDRLFEFIKSKCEIADISSSEEILIRRIAEISKIRLSEEHYIDQVFNLNGRKYQFSINDYELKALLEGTGVQKNLLEECRRQIMAAITESCWTTQEVELLILIGGPTRLPCIHDMLRIIFNINKRIMEQIEDFYNGNEKVDRMTAVSVGAALSVERKINDVVPHGHGIEDIEINDEQTVYRPNILVPCDSPYPFNSNPCLIQWVNLNGLFEFKIIQHVPKSEIDNFGYEYRFIGIIRFAVKNPNMSLVFIQMGYNSNKELVITIINALVPSEFTTYSGINNYACIGMKYPLSVKRPPNLDRSRIRKTQPSAETLDVFIKWVQVIRGLIQKKVDDYPIFQMFIQQILDEITQIFNKQEEKTEFEQMYTKINSLIWNASTKGLLNQSQFNELNNRLTEFQNELFRITVG
jgi:molecular chaperone DnaK (HSP70)